MRRIFPLGTRGPNGPLATIAARYHKHIPAVVAIGLVASILEGVGIGLFLPLLVLMMDDAPATGDLPEPVQDLAATFGGLASQSQFLVIGAALLVLIVIKGLVQTGNATLIGWLTGLIGRDVRSALSAKILALDYDFFLRHDVDRLHQVISADSWHVTDVAREALSTIPAFVALLIFGAFLAWLDWRLFAAVVIGTAIIRAWLYVVERRLERLSFEVTDSNHRLGEQMFAVVTSMRVIRVFDQQEREQAGFERLAERVRKAMFRRQGTSAWIAPGVEVLTSLLFILILFLGYRLGVSLAEIVAFVLLLIRAQSYARTISEARVTISSVRGSVEEVEWLLGYENRPAAAIAGALPPGGLPVRFDQVSFIYPGDRLALSEASFELRPGVVTALIGRSGSGKSTVVNLLCRLIEPETGVITVGDTDMAEIPARQWRGRLAIAGQDIELVDGTIAENIAYGKPDATHEEIKLAARTAGCEGFLGNLPDGFETRVGHGGARLSGGQRQRIGIARALVRRPEILILDEAINAVDSISEAEILKLLTEHRHFHTALVVSHRRSTLAICQDCIVLDHGRVVESGPLDASSYYLSML